MNPNVQRGYNKRESRRNNEAETTASKIKIMTCKVTGLQSDCLADMIANYQIEIIRLRRSVKELKENRYEN